MPPLCPARVASVLHSTPSAKAAGFDGWRYEELKAWPPGLVLLLTQFYGVVERAGRWPKNLSTALVALLPKGTTGLAEDYRPINGAEQHYRSVVLSKASSPFGAVSYTQLTRPTCELG